MTTATTDKPMVTGADRIELFDVLRGVAILGIFAVNLIGFAQPMAAYLNPTVYGSLDGLNGWAWGIVHVFFDTKFITIFSLLFGAGLVVAGERAQAAGRSAWGRHFRRSAILLAVGLTHAYLVWSGDILTFYAVLGFFLFVLRRAGPIVQTVLAFLLFAVVVLINGSGQAFIGFFPEEAIAELRTTWEPAPEKIAAQLTAYQGGWMEQQPVRVADTLSMHTQAFCFILLWRVSSMMLLGMALYKWGVLTGRRSPRFYAILAVVGLSLGLSLTAYGAWWNWSGDFALERSFFGGSLFNYVGSLLTALGYIGVIGAVVSAGVWEALRKRFVAVGRMSFTFYLGQTLIATTLFYGHGFGLFGEVSRTWLLVIFLAVTALQLLVAPWWLRRFRQGPLEYLLRVAVYGRLTPFRRENAA